MRYLVWILRLLVFVLILLFALKNTGTVDVNFYADHVATGVPLIVVMLVAFVLGVVFGLLLTVPSVMRRRREVKKLKRDMIRLQDRLKFPGAPSNAPAPETMAPLAPF
ncbi:MAG TPA: LapA family protein [Paralcaligenes sp.]|jgi:uncharacterized integral membrane protein